MAAAAVAGCMATGQGDGPADGGSTVSGRSIIVSNSGEAEGEPDLAVLEVAVQSTGDDPGAVRDDLATRADDLRAALLEHGVEEEDITTRRFSIHDRIDRAAMEADGVEPRSRGDVEEYVYYEGTHSYSVETEDVDGVGGLIDAAVEGGADTVGRVTFTLSDERRATLREQALRRAIQDAREEAEAIAGEVGASVAEATVVDASDGRVSPVRRDIGYAGDGGAPAPTPEPTTGLEPGDVTVTADVRVRYRMA